MNQVTFNLTGDQADWLSALLDYEVEQETHRIKKTTNPESQRKHVAFITRVRDKLAKAKTS